MQTKEHKRRLSLEEDFMNYSTDDLLYGAMYHLATYDPDTKELYLSKQNYEKHRKDFYLICDVTAKTLKRHLDKLIERGLIQDKYENGHEIKKLVNGQMVPAFIFPYNKAGKYRLVNNDMLWYLASTRNKCAIRVYLYLYNGFLWKEEKKEKFIFTNNSILQALGLSSNNKLASSAITNILISFSKEGVIKYSQIWESYINEYGKTIPVPRMQLDFIAEKENEFIK